jgi:hypothetical protein
VESIGGRSEYIASNTGVELRLMAQSPVLMNRCAGTLFPGTGVVSTSIWKTQDPLSSPEAAFFTSLLVLFSGLHLYRPVRAQHLSQSGGSSARASTGARASVSGAGSKCRAHRRPGITLRGESVPYQGPQSL